MIVAMVLFSFFMTLRLSYNFAADTMRPMITGQRGIVAAGRHYSVSGGVRMLEQGGNAFDAGVAAVFAAAVAEISHFGFGGEAPVVLFDAQSKQVAVINGQGPAPKGASVELFKSKGKIDANGPLGATVPAVLDAMTLVLEKYGTMRLEQVLQPAIELADGFPMYEYLANVMKAEKKNCEPWKATMETYYPDGRPPEAGEMFRQPNLAKTLRAIVAAERDHFRRHKHRATALRAGRDLFYKGSIGRAIVEANRAAGGVFTYEDLANYQGRLEKPAMTTYRGYEVYKAGPWNQGPVLLQTLNILEGFDLAGMGHLSTEYIHTVTEAIKLAYDDRDAYYGDPDFVRVPMQGLLSKTYAGERQKLIDRRQARLDHRPGDPYRHENGPQTTLRSPYLPHAEGSKGTIEIGDTTGVNVVDQSGNLFSCTPSSGWILGGAFIAGDTGVPLSNRMQAFVLDPRSPNGLVGGKRPRTTLTPTIILKDGRPFLAMSTPGGDNQDQQILNVLLNIVDFGMDVQAAIEAPRFNSQHMFASFDNHADNPGSMDIEDRVAPGVIVALRAKGHKVNVKPAYGISTGITAVGLDPKHKTLRGGADVRRERYIFGW
ncbi:MAG: gamma-glutamyltransferase family protein [Acidobacteria bacterium]|nr:gamma-glutamyltransferase family protein [Acidobacteriota bacterium]